MRDPTGRQTISTPIATPIVRALSAPKGETGHMSSSRQRTGAALTASLTRRVRAQSGADVERALRRETAEDQFGIFAARVRDVAMDTAAQVRTRDGRAALHELIGSSSIRLEDDFSSRVLEVSADGSGRLRGWVYEHDPANKTVIERLRGGTSFSRSWPATPGGADRAAKWFFAHLPPYVANPLEVAARTLA